MTADEYRAGKTGLLGFFVGQVMRQSGGNANPALVTQLGQERLGGVIGVGSRRSASYHESGTPIAFARQTSPRIEVIIRGAGQCGVMRRRSPPRRGIGVPS